MDAILGMLRTAMPVLTILWGMFVKYHPKLASVPNSLIPYMNAAAFLVTSLAGPQEAHAAGFAASAVGAFATSVLGACWESLKTSLIYEIFLRHPLEKGVQLQKAQ